MPNLFQGMNYLGLFSKFETYDRAVVAIVDHYCTVRLSEESVWVKSPFGEQDVKKCLSLLPTLHVYFGIESPYLN
jgi:hypothetical protein